MCLNSNIYHLTTLLGKDIFTMAFYSKWKYFVMIDHILSGTIKFGLFCFCTLFSNIYCKFNFTAKNGSDLHNFYRKLNVWIFLLKYIVCFSSLILNYYWCSITISQYRENFRNFKQVEQLKIFIETTYPIEFCIYCSHFGKKWKYSILLKPID